MISPEIMDAILDQHSAIVGKTGSGKTYTAKGEVEYLLERQRRACIVDPTGAWWGLRSSKSGKKSGFPVVVFGGDHADVPITRDMGARLAEIIAGGNFPSIVDLSDLSRTAGRTFMTAFLNTLYKKNRSPLNLIIDEADIYAPQRPLPDSKLVLNAMENIVSRGRIRGLRIMMITQRPAKLHKDCLTQVNSITMMRVMAPQDRNALKAWVAEQGDEGRGEDIIASLPKLDVGSGWVWAPEVGFLEQVKFPPIKTFDSSRAPGADGVNASIKFAPVDLTALAGMLEDEKPKPKAKAKPQPQPQAPKHGIDIKAMQDKCFVNGHAAGFDDGFEAGRKAAYEELLERMQKPITCKRPKVAQPKPRTVAPFSKLNGRTPPRTVETLPLDVAGDRPLGPERRPLTTLAQHHPARLTEAQWATLTGMKRTSGTWGTYKSRLNQAGYIERDGSGLFTITGEGLAAMGTLPDQPTTTDQVLDMWRKAVGPASKLLNILIDYRDAPITRADLAQHAEMSPNSGTFGTYLSRLNSNGLIEKTGDGFRASPHLFLTPGGSQQ